MLPVSRRVFKRRQQIADIQSDLFAQKERRGMNNSAARFFFVALLVLIPFFPSAALENKKTVTVATLEDYAPFCFKTGDCVKMRIPPGEDTVNFEGYSWDILRESFHVAGYTVKLSVTPWARAMAYLKMGECDILFPTGKNKEREAIFDYSEEPVNQARFLVYVRAESSMEWQGLETLSGLTIGVKRGFNYGDTWKNAGFIRKYSVNTIRQGFRMLSQRRIDGFAGYEFNWDYVLRQEGWRDRYVKMPSFDSSAEFLVALKSNPKGLQYLKAFDEGKRQLIKSGRYERIREKWLGP